MASAMRTDVAEADAVALDGFDPEQVDMMAEAVILVDEMDRPLGRPPRSTRTEVQGLTTARFP